ncbi:GNAT family N-acetyltransferase [Flammeovirga agarivorans]|uniref:N-acetyltransferase n=1 Tax=Flammeovirga agarivorans TaxID=2726742 RepID=A0A7X8XXF2_9BACT|nr:N-acetyltransferase [Flammeovirga agarivorans]NLR93108.1 N-acetyltransferase [Flammeovirga agarivorans]
MQIKTYHPSNKERLIEIFHSNCPKYFDPNDEEYLIDFLDNYTDENYYVVENENGSIIGCGGYYTKEDHHGIPWVMFESKSIGAAQLLSVSDTFYKEIENKILAEGKGLDININTTQLMEKLFNRYGFKTYEIIKDGFGEGLDEYKMKKQFS